MVKVLIYSSKEIYDKSSYAGRAEADLIAYRDDDGVFYTILKNRTNYQTFGGPTTNWTLRNIIRKAEDDEWKHEKRSAELTERYKTHPAIELMKNA